MRIEKKNYFIKAEAFRSALARLPALRAGYLVSSCEKLFPMNRRGEGAGRGGEGGAPPHQGATLRWLRWWTRWFLVHNSLVWLRHDCPWKMSRMNQLSGRRNSFSWQLKFFLADKNTETFPRGRNLFLTTNLSFFLHFLMISLWEGCTFQIFASENLSLRLAFLKYLVWF